MLRNNQQRVDRDPETRDRTAETEHRSQSKNECSIIKNIMDPTAKVLFGKTRRAVLATLLETPGQRFYLRELARLTDTSPGALQAELDRLRKAELVIREKDGHRVAYAANANHPVFPELQALIRKTCGLPARLRSALESSRLRIDFAAIYGSTAKGTAGADSDIDVIAVGDVTLGQLVETLAPLEQELGREISIRVFTPRDFRQRLEDRDAFVERVLNGPLITLKGSISDA